MPSLVPRDWFAALDRCTYINQASLGLIPAAAVESIHSFMNEKAQFGNLYVTDDQETTILDGVRAVGAGCSEPRPTRSPWSGALAKDSAR